MSTVQVGKTLYEDDGSGTLVAVGEVEGNGQRPDTVRAVDVQPEAVEWLWENYVPRGMTTVIGGFPGVGKSTIDYDLAARVSQKGEVVLVLTAEDHLAAVVRPRLEAAGADLDLVRIVTIPITLPDDVGRLKELVREFEASLVLVDPLVAFIGDGVNTHRDHHVRRVLAPLADLAEETRAAMVVVIHTNKGTGSEPLMRISGSIGFTGAARSVLLAAEDPQDEGRRILAVVKSNLAEMPPPLAYRLAGVALEGGISTSKVEWLGEAPEVDVRELLATRDPEDRGATEDAGEFLSEMGLLESARPAGEVEKEAKARGHSQRTVRRARRMLGIPAWKDGFPGTWYWGPRPNGGAADLANRSGQPTLGHLAGSARPAETGGSGPDLANREMAGEGPRQAFEIMSSSDSEEWYTPPHIVGAVLSVLGEIDLDPCANPGEPTVPAKAHYRKADDGLRQRWPGRVYMNPPYGRAIPVWVQKLVDEHRWGHVTEAIALVPSRPDANWFAQLDPFLRCEIRGRVKFIDGKAGREYGAPFPSVVFYLGSNEQRFTEVFSALGRIVQPVESPSLVQSSDGQGASDGCPECGARSADRGYWGHAMNCSRRTA